MERYLRWTMRSVGLALVIWGVGVLTAGIHTSQTAFAQNGGGILVQSAARGSQVACQAGSPARCDGNDTLVCPAGSTNIRCGSGTSLAVFECATITNVTISRNKVTLSPNSVANQTAQKVEVDCGNGGGGGNQCSVGVDVGYIITGAIYLAGDRRAVWCWGDGKCVTGAQGGQCVNGTYYTNTGTAAVSDALKSTDIGAAGAPLKDIPAEPGTYFCLKEVRGLLTNDSSSGGSGRFPNLPGFSGK